MAASGRRTALFGAVAAALFTTLTLGLVEVALQVVDYPRAAFSPWVRSDVFGFRLAPDIAMPMRSPEYDVEVATNSLGMRDEEPGPKSGPRILLLGDSYTMGYGVPRGAIFADLLEKDLGVDVVNAGTGGYEIIHQAQVLAEYGPLLKPDLVVYALYLGNDLAQNDEWELRPDGTLHSLVREYPVRQKREVKLKRLLRDAWYGARLSRGDRGEDWLPEEGYLGLCEKTPGDEARSDYDEAERLVEVLAERAKAIGAGFLVVLVPYRSMVEAEAAAALRSRHPDFDERYDLGRPAREIGARLGARGIAWADSTPFLTAEHGSRGVPLFFPVDGHFNVAGHEAFARFALPLLLERLPGKPHL